MEHVEKFQADVAALLVVDVQNDFCHPEGAMARHGRDVTAVPQMVPRLEGLVAAARGHGAPVIWVHTAHDERTNTAAWLARKATTLRTETPPHDNCRPGTWGAEPFVLCPQAGEPVVVKHRYSAFAGTDLDWTLRALERRSLLVTGVATETCVESTLRDGLFHDYHVNLVEDCCASYQPEAHAASVRNAAALFGLVTRSNEVTAQWKKLDLNS